MAAFVAKKNAEREARLGQYLAAAPDLMATRQASARQASGASQQARTLPPQLCAALSAAAFASAG